MKKLVRDEIYQPECKKHTIVLNEPFKIDRNKATKEIVTKSMNKAYKLVFDKRVVLPNRDSLLYGYSLDEFSCTVHECCHRLHATNIFNRSESS